jgi:hypothetical protein
MFAGRCGLTSGPTMMNRKKGDIISLKSQKEKRK